MFGSAIQSIILLIKMYFGIKLFQGFDSVMVDGSHLSFKDNITYTKSISLLAHSKNMMVEAELGRLSGTEDDLTVEDYEAKLTDVDQVTSLSNKSISIFFFSFKNLIIIIVAHLLLCEMQALQFIDETGIDALAVCIGNVHGKYPASGPNLRLDLLRVSSHNCTFCFLVEIMLIDSVHFTCSLGFKLLSICM